MKERLIKIVKKALKDLSDESGNFELKNPTPRTCLYGEKGYLDSLALVRLIVSIEVMILKEFGKKIVLADEKAVSQKRSPFRTIESLAGYAEKLLNETRYG